VSLTSHVVTEGNLGVCYRYQSRRYQTGEQQSLPPKEKYRLRLALAPLPGEASKTGALRKVSSVEIQVGGSPHTVPAV
jgi:hypothetical protein